MNRENNSKIRLLSSSTMQLAGLALVAIAYWLAVRAGLLLVAQPEGVASIWPASGLALAVLLLSPKRQWMILLAVIFVTNAAGNLSGGNSLLVSLGFALANTLESLLAAWALEYFCKSKITFERTVEIFALFGIAIFSNGITALLGAAVPALASGAPFWRTWFLWWTVDGLGMILIAPFIVTWATSQDFLRSVFPRRSVEAVLLGLMLAAFAWLLFGPFTVAEDPLLHNYMFFPLLIWLAFRYGPRGMASALVLVALIAIWNTLRGYGIFAFAAQNTTERLESVQFFLSVMAFSGLLLSAIVTERQQAEGALRLSEALLNASQQLSKLGGWEWDIDNQSIFWADETYHIHDLVPGEIAAGSAEHIAKSSACYDPQDRPIVLAAFQRCVEQGEPYDLEFPFTSVRGRRMWIRTTARAVWDSGRIVKVIGNIMDITERRQAAEALRESEKRYKRLLDSVTDYIYSVQARDGLAVATIHGPGCAGVTGYTPEDYVTDPDLWYRMVYEPDRAAVVGQAARVLADEDVPPLEHRIIHRDGSMRWVRNTCVPRHDQQMRLIAYDGLIQDITARKKAETRLRRFWDLPLVGMAITSPDRRFLEVNQKLADMFGYTPEELTRMTWAELTHPDDLAENIRLLERTLVGETDEYAMDKRFIRRDGMLLYTHIAARCIRRADGMVDYLALIVQDITERKQAEEEIKQLNATLEQRVEERTQELRDAQEKIVRQEKLSVLGQMAGSVGHELRNPLAVISNAVYFLKLIQPDASDKVKEYLAMIERQVHISDKIVADLLDFTRIKSVDREPVSVSELIQQTLKRFPASESVKVTLDLPADLPKAYADPQHVIQILGNLTLNACQAMSGGGKLLVLSRVEGSVSSRQSSEETASLITDHWILITVRDTGSGISPENMKKLFEPLFTTKTKGIGLGLAVSKKLIEANGGRIEVESEVGVGSTFTIYLPAVKE